MLTISFSALVETIISGASHAANVKEPISAWKYGEWTIGFLADLLTFVGASVIGWEGIFKAHYGRRVSNVETGLRILSKIGRVKSKDQSNLGPADAERLVRVDFIEKGWILLVVGFSLQIIARLLNILSEVRK